MSKKSDLNGLFHEFKQPKTIEDIQQKPIEERREIVRACLRGDLLIIGGL